jgi:hypothetical protein
VAGAFVLLLVVVAILAPHIVPFDPENFFDYDALNAGPSAAHWFGVDSLGPRHLQPHPGRHAHLAGGRLLLGDHRRVIGTVLGLLAGYYEGWWDRIVMRICDVLFAFPGILLAIGIVAILGNGMVNVIFAVAVFSIPAFARLVRGNTLMLKRLTYVEAARSIGASDWTIMMRHILPGTVSSIVVYFDADRHVDHHGRRPVVPGPGRAAAHARVGRDAQRGARRHGDRAARGDLPEPGDLPDRAGVQPAGRRPARRARSEDRPALMAASPMSLPVIGTLPPGRATRSPTWPA